MNEKRRLAVVVGVLYILGTVFGITSVALLSPLTGAENMLTEIVNNQNRFISGVSAIFLMGICLTFIPVLLYPLFKKNFQKAGIICLVFRSGLEMVSFLFAVFVYMALLFLSRNTFTVTMDPATQGILGSTLADLTRNPFLAFIFSIYAFTLYVIFYHSRLIPRWISIFGIVAISLHFITGFLTLFGLQEDFSTSNLIMNFPIFLQEMVMAVYLIVKGFNEKALEDMV
jgi:hypothetical protein